MTDDAARIHVLFVCVHNSARSLMAEALLRHRGRGAFAAYSAGTEAGVVNPLTLRVLSEASIPIDGLSSKPVQPLAGEQFDYVITVCDPAREACPYFPGAGTTLHWSFDDPSAATGSEKDRLPVFRRVLHEISIQIDDFMPLAIRANAARQAISTA